MAVEGIHHTLREDEMGSSNNDDLQAGMVSAARDAALAGAERIHDARREFLKLFGMGAAAAAGMGGMQ